jgi:hypothetical protein
MMCRQADVGTLYGIDPRDGGWIVLGSRASIDPGSGTTPAEYLAAARDDVGGVTLRRITENLSGIGIEPARRGQAAHLTPSRTR